MNEIIGLLEGVGGVEGLGIIVAVAVALFGISKLPGPWKKRVVEVVDKVDAELDKQPKE